MTGKRNGVIAFFLSLLPGAGEMYMGFMKQGISIMGSLFGIIVLLNLGLNPLAYGLPLIWFYGFFHVHNLRALPDEEFYQVEDRFFFHLDSLFQKNLKWKQAYRKIAAAILIFLGISMLWGEITNVLEMLLPAQIADQIWRLAHNMPQYVTAVILIVVGIRLIAGKKKALDDMEEKDGEIL